MRAGPDLRGNRRARSFRCPYCGYAKPKAKVGEEHECSVCGTKFIVTKEPEWKTSEVALIRHTEEANAEAQRIWDEKEGKK